MTIRFRSGDPPVDVRSMSFRFATLIALALTLGAASVAAVSSQGASSSVTVSMSVASHISLTNGCTSAASTEFGNVLPGTAATTATGAAACRFDFTSNNDSAMLRIGQRDGTGTAMQSAGAWSTGSWNGLHMLDVAAATTTLRFAVGRSGAFHRSVDSGATWSTWTNIDGNSSWLNDIEPVPGAPATCYVAGPGPSVVHIGNCDAGTPTFTVRNSALTAAGWPIGRQVLGLEVIDASTVVVVGEAGWVAKTTDGGASFAPAFQISGASQLHAVDSIDANNMIVVGNGSTVNAWRTTTGGGTAPSWSNFDTTTLTSLRDLDVINSTNAYAVGINGVAVRWNGTSWAQIHTRPLVHETLTGVAADSSSPSTVYAVAMYGQVVRSIDAGATWTRIDSGLTEELTGIDSVSGTDAIAVGDAMAATRTNDGTSWWASFGHPTARTWAGLAAHPTNGQVGLAAGSQGRIRRTTDGGQTWSHVTTPANNALLGVAYGTGSVAYAVGDGGTILTSIDGGATWTPRPSGVTVRLWGVAAAEGDHAWAVGDGGTVLRTTDGGATWQARSSGTTERLQAVSAMDRDRVVAVGKGVAPRTTDGGATWTAAGTVPNAFEYLVSVDHASSNVLYAATRYQNVWKSTDAGNTWSSFSVAPSDLYSISAVDESTALVGSPWGRLTTISNGGSTVSTTTVGGSFHYLGVAATGRESGFAVGTGNVAAWQIPSAAGTRQIADYGTTPANWAGSGNSSMFGACLQAIGVGTTAAWMVDSTPTGTPACTTSDSDPWNAIPATPTKVASLTSAGSVGSVDLVWGVRLASDQAQGAYAATVVVEALAPNA